MPRKKILVYGDSNTWGWIGVPEAFPSTRYDDHVRWAGVLASALGDGYNVAVDGLTVRATNLPDTADWNAITADMFDGAKTLPAAIAREMPVDLLIVALGTNDLKAETGRSAEEIAEAIIDVARVAQGCGGGVAYSYEAPKVLVMSPPPLSDMPNGDFAAMFAGGKSKSETLGAALKTRAETAGFPSFDAGAVVGPVTGVDGLHLDEAQHAKLGRAVAEAVRSL